MEYIEDIDYNSLNMRGTKKHLMIGSFYRQPNQTQPEEDIVEYEKVKSNLKQKLKNHQKELLSTGLRQKVQDDQRFLM